MDKYEIDALFNSLGMPSPLDFQQMQWYLAGSTQSDLMGLVNEKPQIDGLVQNKTQIDQLISDSYSFVKAGDLYQYALKTDIPQIPDLSGFITSSNISQYLTPFVTEDGLSQYALKTDIPQIPDLSGFITSSNISQYLPDLSGFITSSTISDYLPDLTPYITGDQLNTTLLEYSKTTDIHDWVGTQGFLTSIPSSIVDKSYLDTKFADYVHKDTLLLQFVDSTHTQTLDQYLGSLYQLSSTLRDDVMNFDIAVGSNTVVPVKDLLPMPYGNQQSITTMLTTLNGKLNTTDFNTEMSNILYYGKVNVTTTLGDYLTATYLTMDDLTDPTDGLLTPINTAITGLQTSLSDLSTQLSNLSTDDIASTDGYALSTALSNMNDAIGTKMDSSTALQEITGGITAQGQTFRNTTIPNDITTTGTPIENALSTWRTNTGLPTTDELTAYINPLSTTPDPTLISTLQNTALQAQIGTNSAFANLSDFETMRQTLTDALIQDSNMVLSRTPQAAPGAQSPDDIPLYIGNLMMAEKISVPQCVGTYGNTWLPDGGIGAGTTVFTHPNGTTAKSMYGAQQDWLVAHNYTTSTTVIKAGEWADLWNYVKLNSSWAYYTTDSVTGNTGYATVGMDYIVTTCSSADTGAADSGQVYYIGIDNSHHPINTITSQGMIDYNNQAFYNTISAYLPIQDLDTDMFFSKVEILDYLSSTAAIQKIYEAVKTSSMNADDLKNIHLTIDNLQREVTNGIDPVEIKGIMNAFMTGSTYTDNVGTLFNYTSSGLPSIVDTRAKSILDTQVFTALQGAGNKTNMENWIKSTILPDPTQTFQNNVMGAVQTNLPALPPPTSWVPTGNTQILSMSDWGTWLNTKISDFQTSIGNLSASDPLSSLYATPLSTLLKITTTPLPDWAIYPLPDLFNNFPSIMDLPHMLLSAPFGSFDLSEVMEKIVSDAKSHLKDPLSDLFSKTRDMSSTLKNKFTDLYGAFDGWDILSLTPAGWDASVFPTPNAMITDIKSKIQAMIDDMSARKSTLDGYVDDIGNAMTEDISYSSWFEGTPSYTFDTAAQQLATIGGTWGPIDSLSHANRAAAERVNQSLIAMAPGLVNIVQSVPALISNMKDMLDELKAALEALQGMFKNTNNIPSVLSSQFSSIAGAISLPNLSLEADIGKFGDLNNWPSLPALP